MKNIQFLIVLLFILALQNLAEGQNPTQTIRGTVVDKDAQVSLIGATVLVAGLPTEYGSVTDLDGSFTIKNVPTGRHEIHVSYIGYEPLVLSNVLLSSGKELVLKIELTESVQSLSEVVVSASSQLDKTKPLNEFATVSARTFSVEETSRYAFSAFDPARMAQAYAGVATGGSDDIMNEIVIRGNSPRGLLWRLEGIEIPNPNHFGELGSTGGGISMLSSSTLSNSDFYTGAFPAEFGNALSGVFDLNLRNGNNEQREYSFMFGLLGIELAAEGPFSGKGKGSYLVNYRYSTFAAIKKLGLAPGGDFFPEYQDISFKINLPSSKAGTFSLFGIGGKNSGGEAPDRDSLQWKSLNDGVGEVEKQDVGTIGLSHRLLLSNDSYLKTVVMGSYQKIFEENYYLVASDNYRRVKRYSEDSGSSALRFSTMYHLKLNSKNTFRSGLIVSSLGFNYLGIGQKIGSEELETKFDNNGNSGLLQGYFNWKNRTGSNLTLNGGLHYSMLTMNNNFALDPRLSARYQISEKNALSASVGLHSKMEGLPVYLFEGEANGVKVEPNNDLELSKAFHAVLAYDHNFRPNLRLKLEAYYQYLFDIPEAEKKESYFSLINSSDVLAVLQTGGLASSGIGRNFGVDFTLEKFFSNQYYFLLTGSVYSSQFEAPNGKWFNTLYNGNYQCNLLGGKEFKVGKNKQNILGINGKFLLSGGRRQTPIDLAASKLAGREINNNEAFLSERLGTYARFDVGLSYRKNTNKKLSHTFLLDVQNVTNRENIYNRYFNKYTGTLGKTLQAGLFPNFNYRLEF